ncbi:MAG TPA: hypothetical protein VGM39_04400 [Kofleriaceae bacterium]|jgi:hypothetical protein
MRAFILVAVIGLVGCIDDLDPAWSLEHDRVIAVRMSSPSLTSGQTATMDALVAQAGSAVMQMPLEAAALQAPDSLAHVVALDGTVTAPDAATLAAARTELGLVDQAAVPLDVYAAFADRDGKPMYAKKRVWLDDPADPTAIVNPAPPLASMDGAPMSDDALVVARTHDVYLSTTVPDGWRVNWFSSCGTLFQDDVATSFMRIEDGDAVTGELAVVVRTPGGGVAWRTWPISAQ